MPKAKAMKFKDGDQITIYIDMDFVTGKIEIVGTKIMFRCIETDRSVLISKGNPDK